MNFAHIRKTVAAAITGVVTIAGEALNAGLVHGTLALWLGVLIACGGGIASAIAVYSVPNGASLSDRVKALEKLADPVTDTAEIVYHDLHAGVAKKAPWPTPVATPPTAPAGPPAAVAAPTAQQAGT